jgi:GNAT superfamily N-acetyltransferase
MRSKCEAVMPLEELVEFREMLVDEIARIGEVNREESIRAAFVVESDGSGFGLVARRVEKSPPLEVPPWGEPGTQIRVNKWRPGLERGGSMYGAFSKDRLVGFVILGPRQQDGSGEVVALFVDKDYRRAGIAKKLMAWVYEKARALEINALFLYSNPTGSAVGFYLNEEFEIVSLTSKTIVSSLPGDIGMAKWVIEEKGRPW